MVGIAGGARRHRHHAARRGGGPAQGARPLPSRARAGARLL